MIRVHVICEGQTEETFVKEILDPFFTQLNMGLIPALLGKPGHKGGNLRFDRLRIDLRNRLLGDSTAYCTTFIDFYGLPTDFPGKSDAALRHDIGIKAATVCNAMNTELAVYVGSEPLRRFIPYVQMYEFEALILSDPSYFDKWFDTVPSGSLLHECQQFATPEHINDSPLTAPSKRILKYCEGYQKPQHGPLIAIEIGLETIRQGCPLFSAWLDQLANLNPLP